MNTEKEKVVLYTDESSAKKETVTGWVSRHGRFYGDNEHLARYDGCTHQKCECGNLMTKGWTKCDWCISKSNIEKYKSYPFEEWDGLKPICTHDGEHYFFNEDEIEEYCEENEIKPEDLMLVICKPNYARKIDSSIWEDDLAEDSEIPKELQEKINEMNNVIGKLKPLSYSPSKVRTQYKTNTQKT